MSENNTPVKKLYDSRSNFSIIGLTGKTGSGCSYLANLMSSSDFLDYVKKPDDIIVEEPQFLDNEIAYYHDNQDVLNQAIHNTVEKRKYQICFDFAVVNYQPYTVVKYTHIIWLYTILYYANNKERFGNSYKSLVRLILFDKFIPSVEDRDNDYKELIGFSDDKRKFEIEAILDGFPDWSDLENAFGELNDIIDESHIKSDKAKSLTETFTSEIFRGFVTYLLDKLARIDLYSLCFLHHRLATQIRKCGNVEDSYNYWYDKESEDYNNLYRIVKLINYIIKGYRAIDEANKPNCSGTRIVIDSIRNSIEAAYLKERYSAFYLMAVSNDTDRETQLRDALCKKSGITNDKILDRMQEKIINLSNIELENDDFEKGMFSSPNVSQVIADAEIHLSNSNNSNICFSTLAEQWLKYSCLILHPGLITPSTEERCMVVAYTAKFNSSCVSRQVGAVITNQYHSIRTIGWNEVPYGQMPCGLRDIRELMDKKSECHRCKYSEFERGINTANIYKDYSAFTDKVACDDKIDLEIDKQLNGLPYSYCFKTLHNRYKHEKNQVYTRSLHAEENAILQMAKYGGEPLMNGIIYVTASPCELCSKKLYQIGVRKIVYIDPYPGIAKEQIIQAGFKRPNLKLFQGAYGASYFKLYQPFMSYKDELSIRIPSKNADLNKTKDELLKEILEMTKSEIKDKYSTQEYDEIVAKYKGLMPKQ